MNIQLLEPKRYADESDEKFIRSHAPFVHSVESFDCSKTPVDVYTWYVPEKNEALVLTNNGKCSFLFVYPTK